jgi:hypothetical protein
MSESERYWRTVVDKLDSVTKPFRRGGEFEEEPAWVNKLTWELFNMITPKMQLRAGIRATADKVGVIVGSHWVQMAQAAAFRELPKPRTEPDLAAFNMGLRLGTPPGGFDVEAVHQNVPALRDKIVATINGILKNRPVQESAEFFRGFSRGLSQNERSLIPELKDGRLQYTPKQFELIRRVAVYTVARHNWRELDKLETSQQAFDWFEKRLPGPILGNDPERIRKMFYRVGKRFKKPGRPEKRDRSPVRVLL